MDTTTINQIIDTGGIIALGLMVIFFYWRGLKVKENLNREIDLLMDCYFFREMIELYKAEFGKDNHYNRFRDEVRAATGYSPSTRSTPSEIRKRLEQLNRREETIRNFLDKVSPST